MLLQTINLFAISSLVHSYTISDIFQSCSPCISGMFLAHPTDCTKYYSCLNRVWTLVDCPASTYYSQSLAPRPSCIDGRNYNQPICPYEKGDNANRHKPIGNVPACSHIATSVTPKNLTTGGAVAGDSTTLSTTRADGRSNKGDRISSERLTLILGSLLGVVVFLVLLAVIVVLIVRWRKRKNRPRNFYSSIPGRGGSSNPNEYKTRGANNDVYLAKSLIKKRQAQTEDIYQEVQDEQPDSGISDAEEIERKPYYSLPPNRRHPRQPVNPSHSTLPPPPVQTVTVAENQQYEGTAPHYEGSTHGTYARTDSQMMEELATYQPIDDLASASPTDDDPTYQPISENPILDSTSCGYNSGAYTHPSNQSTESHQYATPRSESEAQYDYCKSDDLSPEAEHPNPVPPPPEQPAPLPPLPPTPGGPPNSARHPPTAPKPLPRARAAPVTEVEGEDERLKSGDSAPYYFQPIADTAVEAVPENPRHNYHTLEPMSPQD